MIVANLKRDTTSTIASGILWQYDYGQVLRLHGLDLPETVEVHFALKETDGDIVTRIGTTTDGVTDVAIPDTMLEGNDATYNFKIFAFVYLTDETSGETVCKIILPVTSRPKARAIETPEEEEAFRASILALINEAINEVKDDVIPYVGENGNWFINGQDTEIQSRGEDGYTPVKGVDYFDGKDGYTPVKGVDYFDGQDGKDGYTPVKGVDYTDGKDGKDGAEGQPGKDGQDGYTPVKGVDYNDGDAGKSAYQYAVDGGYTGTEYEFSKKLAEEGCSVTHFAGGEEITVIDKSEIELKGLSVFGKSEQFTTTGSQLIVNESELIGALVDTTNGHKLYTEPLRAGTYTFSMMVEGKQEKFYVSFKDITHSTIQGKTANTFTLSDDECSRVSYIIVYPQSNGKPIDYIKMEAGEVATPYEPYTGGPSPNPQYPQAIESVGDGGSVEVGVYGKNLIDAKNVGTVVMPDSNDTRSGFVLDEKGTYTMSVFGDFKAEYLYFYLFTNGAWGSQNVMKNNRTQTFTLGENEKILVHVGRNFTFADIEENFQLERGTVATPYEPYKAPQTLTIPTPNGLPGIKVTDATLATLKDAEGNMWCADEIDFKRGVYIQRLAKARPYKPLVFTNRTEGGKCYLFETPYPFGVFFKDANVPCLTTIAKWSAWGNEESSFAVSGYGVYYRESTKTLEEVNAMFAELGTDFEVLGILETPIETPLTAEELAQYEALYANYPTTFIMNASDAWMELEYKIGIKNYVDVEHARIEENTDKKIEEATEYILEQIPSGEPSEITKADLDSWYDEIEV